MRREQVDKDSNAVYLSEDPPYMLREREREREREGERERERERGGGIKSMK